MPTRGHQKGEGVSATADPAPRLPSGIAPASPTEPLRADPASSRPPVQTAGGAQRRREAAGRVCTPPREHTDSGEFGSCVLLHYSPYCA